MLVTSIAPHNIKNQQLAIESWLRLGFSVSSVNTQSEIDELKPRFQSVDFITAQRDAQADCGKPLVYLNDVLAFLGSHGSPVCGLINSDIHLRATPAAVQFLLEEAKNSMILASRTDVETPDDVTGEIYKLGFDVFLFDRSILEILPPTEFCLGQPWWDYWLASCMMLPPRKFPLKFISFPFAFRIKHATDWRGDDSYKKYGMHFAKFLDQGTHDALLTQSSETLRTSLEALSLNVAMAIFFECQWVSCFPE